MRKEREKIIRRISGATRWSYEQRDGAASLLLGVVLEKDNSEGMDTSPVRGVGDDEVAQDFFLVICFQLKNLEVGRRHREKDAERSMGVGERAAMCKMLKAWRKDARYNALDALCIANQ